MEFEMKYLDSVVGFCAACGLSLRGPAIDVGPAEYIGFDCAEKIADVVRAQKKNRRIPAGGPLRVKAVA